MLNGIFRAIKHKTSMLYFDLKYYLALWEHSKKLPALTAGDRQILKALKKDGVYVTTLADLGLNSSSEFLKAAYEQLSQMADPNNAHLEEKLPQIYTVTGIPEIFNWGNDTRLLNIIENYIGLPIAFHGVHLRKDFPSKHQFGTLLWHSDAEDRRIIKIFIYLNDVEQKTGPFEYIPRSLTPIFSWKYIQLYYKLFKSNYMGIDDEDVKPIIPKSAWKSCTGAAGTVIIVDTKNALHHGTVRTEERSTLFFCYTANPPERPELCTQYWDDTYPRAELRSMSDGLKVST
ncbi:phytanoyl-CoA dioxygenase (PhyH) [Nostoc linckia z18]|uniref:Phytanoyl-CoA dioxygenase (PhyH) n=2 Tax=Nostoc linckia TaxID=92942 RepID=A0A9Q5Z6P9_NOSLI|nr:phytanoyl-CoA dioxygenase (PhyH) [Nostoc linckia z1]PHJ64028.1 phytanoyl-CoA dioxygenase (PhyH) [Nostoc linckia z3]PHJ76429.1 phytanoyl-CoA dioxygenase (PhyH) [Nostoc linckia z2]PHJ83122.1 phytanoyl-CoA dioxygenase (PhyH) [Nostoc linckia z4]PHJ87497.1 phytanoyl-CoA dioxygenase (PhyH) [Nostoc linckia z7]PHJ90246.1 phytanoyl-CoA dioxygenase (PhyH) [Nostoc linckia z6]PHJ96325.1 phytanoyl-CoA dioxygenase (PhyH) [Nostoc linckia z8]PHK01595.1 phytanoyl-CoA dioxygenase (PhyH) [Nostoc linckia z9]